MRFAETTVHGAFVIDPEPREDERGFFARLWDRDVFAARGLTADFVQCNESFSARKGTLRGLHYQAAPHGEVKLVRCVRGAIFDVLVDLRPDSSTYTRWFGAEGCAHGYLTLEDQSEVEYPVSCAYHPDAERGIRWNDPRFAIAWPDVEPLTLSPKDRQWPDYLS
jgi:dTDP-4-dehydrorhamnose 3,5-epimerase